MILIATVGPFFAPTDPYDLASVSIMDNRLAPGEKMGFGRMTAWLGTDDAGLTLSAMIYGIRISLTVGIGSGIIAIFIGCSLGLIAAFAVSARTRSSCGSSISSCPSRLS